MRVRDSFCALILLVAMTFPAGLAGQVATIRPSPENPLSPTPQTAAELDDYLEVQDTGDPATRLRRIEAFKSQFSDSEFRHLILFAEWQARLELGRDPGEIIDVALDGIEAQDHFLTSKLGFVPDPSRLEDLPALRYTLEERKAGYYRSIVNAYNMEGDFDRVVEYGELALETMDAAWELFQQVAEEGSETYEQMRLQDESGRLFVLHTLMAGYQSAGDTAKTVETGEAILDVTPLDLQTLMTTSRLMLSEPPEGEAVLEAHLGRAEGYAEEAVRQADAFLAGPDGSSLTAEQQSEIVAEVSATLGDIKFQLEDWAGAEGAYQASVDAVPDAATYYMLGLSSYSNRNLEGTLSAFARAVFLEFPDPQARANLETLFEAANGTAEGLDEFIQSEGAQIPN